MRYRLTCAAVLAALALVFASCQDVPTSTTVDLPQFDIRDAAHGDGNPHFFFLPPMVPAPSPTGTFDGSQSPAVEICVWNGSECGASLELYTMLTGPGSETIRVNPTDEYYIVNWHTDQILEDVPLNSEESYRIRVLVGTQLLGHADVQVVEDGKQLKNVNTDEYIPLLDGTTLPIKFRIEEGFEEGIAAGGAHACALFDRKVYCWGDNTHGELGDGSNVASTAPMPVAGGLSFVRITSSGVGNIVGVPGGRGHTCGLTDKREAYCWGWNAFGQLGDGTTTSRNVPVRAASGLIFATLDAGMYHTCGLTTTDKAYCWGANGPGFWQEDRGPGDPPQEALALGAPTTQLCANPQGNPPGSYRGAFWPCSPTPLSVSGDLSFRSISAGLWATCALEPLQPQDNAGSAVYCWGWDAVGALGMEMETGAKEPTLGAGGRAFGHIVLGNFHSCGLANGDAWCWGARLLNWGQLGSGSFEGGSTPVPVAGGHRFSQLTVSKAGNTFAGLACGRTPNGSAYCWGGSRFGQLGTDAATSSCGGGTTFPCSSVPVPVAGGINFVALSAGNEFVCGVAPRRAVYCWGRNDSGQLGDGTTENRASPVLVQPPRP